MAKPRPLPARSPGPVAAAADKTLRSYAVGAVPILNHFLKRLDLEAILERHLPAEGA